MENSESRIAPSPEAASDDFASPFHDPPGLDPDRPSNSTPRPPDPGDGLISGRLGDYVPVTADAVGRRRRCDGLTPERQVVFLDALARCGVAIAG